MTQRALGSSCHNWSFRRLIPFVSCLWQVEPVFLKYRKINVDISRLYGASFLTKEGSQVVGISSIVRNLRSMIEGSEELKPGRQDISMPGPEMIFCRNSKMTELNNPHLTQIPLCIKNIYK